MSKSILLCHKCYTWVMPRSNRCTECRGQIDLAEPDPPPVALREILGEVMFAVGPVRVRRNRWTGSGLLYATTTGLLFRPHEQRHEVGRETDAGSTRPRIRSALHTLLSLSGLKRPKPILHETDQPHCFNPEEVLQPAELLMENPGAFFVPRDSVQVMKRQLGGWTIKRHDGSQVRLKPEADAGLFHRRMLNLMASASWQRVAGAASRP